jgi:hypothetical protein
MRARSGGPAAMKGALSGKGVAVRTDSRLSEGEREDRVAGLLLQLVSQGVMLSLSAKNLAGVEAAFAARHGINLAVLEKQVLANLDSRTIGRCEHEGNTQ